VLSPKSLNEATEPQARNRLLGVLFLIFAGPSHDFCIMAFMGAAFMSMTVADCFALCVLVALFVGTAAFWIGQGKFSEFWTNNAQTAPERAAPARADSRFHRWYKRP
jgi:hypothetical protein